MKQEKSKLTKEEQFELIKSALEERDYAVDGYKYVNEMDDIYPKDKDGLLYKVETVAAYGGEGQGETYYTVQKVTEKSSGNVAYFQCDAFYTSYDGCDWDSTWNIVEPSEVVVTQYFNI